MKNIAVILTLCFITNMLQAQKIIEKTVDFKQKKKLVLDLQITDSINIQTWNKDEVYAYAVVNINENKDNDAYETAFNEYSDRVEIQAQIKKDYFNKKNCNCCDDEISWKVMIPENVELTIKTINGNIIIAGKTTSVKANTISGFIDMDIPEDKQADLEMKTISGNIYTDLTLNNVDKRIAEIKVSDKLNGGGVPINLETISGDIFLRKSR